MFYITPSNAAAGAAEDVLGDLCNQRDDPKSEENDRLELLEGPADFGTSPR